LRSSLSILGVVFGVAAVVAMSSVGEGARRESLEQIGALGIDSITVRARAKTDAPAAGLRLRDAEAVERVVPALLGVAPLRDAALPVEAGSRRVAPTAVGTAPAHPSAAPPRPASAPLPTAR